TTSTRFNAVKHGLLSEGVTELDGPETFADFSAKVEADLNPVGEVEGFLTRRVALGMVRLKRAALLEAEYITGLLNPCLAETRVVRQPETAEFLEILHGKTETVLLDPGLPARLCAETVNALSDSFQRYETAIENKLYRALNQLERLQRLRRGEKIPAP